MRRAARAVIVIIIALSAACSGDEPAAMSLLAGAVDDVEEGGTFRFTFSSAATSGLEAYDFSGEGEVDYRTNASRMIYRYRDVAFEQLYTSDGFSYSRQGDGRWTREKVERTASQSFDPRSGLKVLGNQVRNVQDLGEEEIDGTTMRHLKAVLRGGRRLSFPIEAWLDSEGRLRRYMTTSRTKFGREQPEVMVRSEVNMFDFGKPVKVKAPPAGDVDIAPARPRTDSGGSSRPAVEPVRGWRSVLSGSVADLQWGVSISASKPAGGCIKVETTPDIGGFEIRRHESEGSSGESSTGRGTGPVVGCDARFPGTERAARIVAVDDAHQDFDGEHYVAGLVDADIVEMTATLVDGTTVPADLAGGAFFVAWEGANPLRTLSLRRKDDVRLLCVSGDGIEEQFREVGSLVCRVL